MKSKTPAFWGLHANPNKKRKIALSITPFLLCIVLYSAASYYRHIENPQDKILPTFTQMGTAIYHMAFEKDPKSDKYILLNDTISSLRRLLTGIIAASFLGLLLGLNMGIFRGTEALTTNFVRVISIIPPLAILPILFIAFGVDEFAKMFLIFLGTFPLICRDIYLYTKKIPREQITKSLTLGANGFQTTYTIIMPQIVPRLLDTTRLSFGAAWLFLIASEAISATSGLGYRIFLVRRYLAMDIILPYVVIITLLGLLIDYLLKKYITVKYPWYNKK